MSVPKHAIDGDIDGRALIRALDQRRIAYSLSRRELAERLDISPAYLSQLANGDKPVSGLSIECLRRCAEFLRQPLVRCLMLSGHLRASDFIGPEWNEREQMQCALAVVACSTWGELSHVTTSQLVALPNALQWLVIRLYESAASQVLFPELPAVSTGPQRPSGK